MQSELKIVSKWQWQEHMSPTSFAGFLSEFTVTIHGLSFFLAPKVLSFCPSVSLSVRRLLNICLVTLYVILFIHLFSYLFICCLKISILVTRGLLQNCKACTSVLAHILIHQFVYPNRKEQLPRKTGACSCSMTCWLVQQSSERPMLSGEAHLACMLVKLRLL